jgi:hypothetical protein
MKGAIVLLSIIQFLLVIINSQNCKKDDAVKAFKTKTSLSPYPYFPGSPYLNQTDASNKYISEILANKEIVCAIKYHNNSKDQYTINQFGTKEEALMAEYIVTHQGPCGVCSTLQDLSVYLEKNLTAPVRRCGMLSVLSNKLSLNCIKRLGFTDQCSQIWLFNSINTKNNCFRVCIKSWIKNEPLNKPNGSLNDCIQCDETISGPIFKYFSGRTRRGSGIESEIGRSGAEVYNITHCYY